MNNLMKCSRCSNMVEETTTSSCAIGGVEITDYLPKLEHARLDKLCSFEDLFFCTECMDGNICKDCSQVLTAEEKDVLKKELK